MTDFVTTLFDNESNPGKVTIAYAVSLKALEQGHSVGLILMIDAVYLARPGQVDGIDIGAPFRAVKELQQAFLDKGGKVFVCESCMEHNGITADEIDPRFEVISAGDVVTLMVESKGSLPIT